VVKKIADEHGARIELGNRYADEATHSQDVTQSLKNLSDRVVGAQVSLSFPVV
jgi:nitrogen fixation/metabolism regulation signal transduction histidine kinase